MAKKRRLNWFEVGIGLAALHYGAGFLLGIGEATYIAGNTGALYGISAALGMLALIIVTSFYWREKDPLWIVLGRKYGKAVQNLVSVLSWIWMIGVVAAQALGGAFILSITGVS